MKRDSLFPIAACLVISAFSAVFSSVGCGKRGPVQTTAAVSPPAAPAPERVYFDQGFALTQQERHADAEPLYRKALEINANEVNSLNNLAWSLAKQGKFEEAVPLFEKVLQIDPNYQLAKNNLGWVKGELQKQGEAPRPAKKP